MADNADGEADVREAIAEMPEEYRALGERLHEIVMDSNPDLSPRTWYGMPAYERDGTVVCYFRVDGEYMTFGLSEDATLSPDEDAPHQLIPSAWNFTGLDDATENELAHIVRAATS